MYRKILVPIDGSEASRLGLQEAMKLARDQDATIRLVHVVDELVITGGLGGALAYAGDLVENLRAGGREILQKAEGSLRQEGLACESTLLEHVGGPASSLIVEEAKRWAADLIVLGTHGRRGIKRAVLGSDAEEIVRTAPVPVLLVRSAG